jgi:hypothetical protein
MARRLGVSLPDSGQLNAYAAGNLHGLDHPVLVLPGRSRLAGRLMDDPEPSDLALLLLRGPVCRTAPQGELCAWRDDVERVIGALAPRTQ